MNYTHLMQIINNIDTNEWLLSNDSGPFVYKNDMLLTFSIVYTDDSFNETWATGHADPNATQAKGYFSYGGNVVHEIYLASIDGGRALLPYPDAQTKTYITQSEYLIAQMFNSRLDEYIQRSKLKVI